MPAVGGARTVPAPDPVARDYIAPRRCGSTSTSPGSSTATSGRPTSRPRSTWSSSDRPPRCATTPPRCAPASPTEVDEPDRRDWLDAQLVALETQAAALAGDALPYLEHVDALLRVRAAAPATTPSSTRPRRELDELLPGDGPLADRLAAWDARFEIPVERLPAVVDWLVGAVPSDAPRRLFGLPDGEDLRVSLVTGPAVVRPTTGSTAAAARASTSTPTCRSGPRT